jgi:hypothetical protein
VGLVGKVKYYRDESGVKMNTISIPPVQFGSVSEWYPENNLRRSDASALYAGLFLQPGDIFRSCLQFDLASVPKKHSPKSAFDSAYLQLYMYRNEIVSGTIDLHLCPLSTPWDEDTLCWNNQPSCVESYRTSFIIPGQWIGLVMFDITFLVREWLNNSIPNYGLLFQGEENQCRFIAFASPEYPEKDKTPQLLVSFEG